MKIKLFLAVGAVVLTAVGGVIAGRASMKFAVPTRIYYTTTFGTCKTLLSSVTVMAQRLTTIGGTCQAHLFTQACNDFLPLYATSTCNKKIYFFPNR